MDPSTSPSSISAVARVVDAAKTYEARHAPVHALRGVSLTIRPGEMVALVGPSGCGKSTLLNLLAGVDRADRGEVVVCGTDLVLASERMLVELRRALIGIVFQSFHLVPHLRVEENVALPLSLAGRRDGARVDMLLERVGLAHRRAHYPAELSGGEQQRTAVARALVHRPRLVLADEPTGNLDSKTGAEVLALLDEARREEGAALLLVTHDALVARRADRTLHMADGVLTQEAP
jgi:putative ABC transport system ATP-binding protein